MDFSSLLKAAAFAFASAFILMGEASAEDMSRSGCVHPGNLSLARAEDTAFCNSLELMAMAGYQTGDAHQINSRLGYSRIGETYRLDLKGSFQEISQPGVIHQSADGMIKASYPFDDGLYGYAALNGNWRNDRADFYYYTVGPGIKVTEGLVLEAGGGQVFIVPGESKAIMRGAFDFKYKFASSWEFTEKFEAVMPLGGTVNYIIDSDTMLAYRIDERMAFKAGVNYNGIDNNKHRVQMLAGVDYKF